MLRQTDFLCWHSAPQKALSDINDFAKVAKLTSSNNRWETCYIPTSSQKFGNISSLSVHKRLLCRVVYRYIKKEPDMIYVGDLRSRYADSLMIHHDNIVCAHHQGEAAALASSHFTRRQNAANPQRCPSAGGGGCSRRRQTQKNYAFWLHFSSKLYQTLRRRWVLNPT